MSVYRSAATMSVGTALSRATGLVRIGAMAFAIGVTGTRLADAYNLANTLPNQLYELLLGGVLTSVFVPIFVGLRKSGDSDSSSLVGVSLAILAIASAAVTFGAEAVFRFYPVRASDPVVREQIRDVATTLFRYFGPQIFLYGASALAEAQLNARGKFGPPKFVPIVNNLCVTAMFVWFARSSHEADLGASTQALRLLGIGTTLGVALQAAVLACFLKRDELRIRFKLSDPSVRRAVRLSGYALTYVAVNQFGIFAVIAIASAQQGGVTAYQIAYAFMLLPHSLFAVSFNSALLPKLSRETGSPEAFRATFREGVRAIAFLILPSAVGLAVLAKPLAVTLLVRGAATRADALVVGSILQMFALGLGFFSAFQFLRVSFSARQDTRTPAVVNAASVGLNVVAAPILFHLFRAPGLAAAFSLSYLFGAVLLARRLTKLVDGGLQIKSLLRELRPMTLGAIVMGLVVWIVSLAFSVGILQLFAGVGTGLVVYASFSHFAEIPERRMMLRSGTNR